MPLQINTSLQTYTGYTADPGTFVDLEIITRQLVVSIIMRYYKNQTAFQQGKQPEAGVNFEVNGELISLPSRHDYEITSEEWNLGTTAKIQEKVKELIESITGIDTVSYVNY